MSDLWICAKPLLGAWQVGESDIDELDLLVVDESQDLIGASEHPSSVSWYRSRELMPGMFPGRYLRVSGTGVML
jgi:hypothetical protein